MTRAWLKLTGTLLSTLLLSSCTNIDSPTQVASNYLNREDISATTRATYPAKRPGQVALFKHHDTPGYPYRVIGVASVYKYDLLGRERNKRTIEDHMRKLAANIGGDGLIDFVTQHDKVQASVIAHEKINIYS